MRSICRYRQPDHKHYNWDGYGFRNPPELIARDRSCGYTYRSRDVHRPERGLAPILLKEDHDIV